MRSTFTNLLSYGKIMVKFRWTLLKEGGIYFRQCFMIACKRLPVLGGIDP